MCVCCPTKTFVVVVGDAGGWLAVVAVVGVVVKEVMALAAVAVLLSI